MNIILNGKAETIAAPQNLQQLLDQQGLTVGFAVMLNQQLISRSQYGDTQLRDQDKIDIIVPMQGG